MPFSELTLPELLLGELGPEPGALLQAESAGRRARRLLHPADVCNSAQKPPGAPLPSLLYFLKQNYRHPLVLLGLSMSSFLNFKSRKTRPGHHQEALSGKPSPHVPA